MREFKHFVDTAHAPDAGLTLPFHLRQKSRQRVTLDNGEQAGLFLARGLVLRPGDRLIAEDGFIVGVEAAMEKVSVVRTDDPLKLARACFHLGNRHVPVQINSGQVCYLHDHVLDEMLNRVGLAVTCAHAAFDPEPGAYGHLHDHGHAQSA